MSLMRRVKRVANCDKLPKWAGFCMNDYMQTQTMREGRGFGPTPADAVLI